MSNPYKTKTITRNGREYLVEWSYDPFMGPPWEVYDEGHGVVSAWTTRSKAPGERVLCSDRSRVSHRYYDIAESIRVAKRNGWSLEHSDGMTAGQIAAAAVEADFKWLKAWCDGSWWWASLKVTCGGDEAHCGGIEDGYDITEEATAFIVDDLIDEVERSIAGRISPVWEMGI